jgi:hypothetical protein
VALAKAFDQRDRKKCMNKKWRNPIKMNMLGNAEYVHFALLDRVTVHADFVSLSVDRSLPCLAWLENCLHGQNVCFSPWNEHARHCPQARYQI